MGRKKSYEKDNEQEEVSNENEIISENDSQIDNVENDELNEVVYENITYEKGTLKLKRKKVTRNDHENLIARGFVLWD